MAKNVRTTVNGYKFRATSFNPRFFETERWMVGKEEISNINYFGDIAKIFYHPDKRAKPLTFWMCERFQRIGHRLILERRVANTRREALEHLLKLAGIKK